MRTRLLVTVLRMTVLVAVLLGWWADEDVSAFDPGTDMAQQPMAVTELEEYIPQRMKEGNVPGLSIAVIRDGEVLWAQGYGVANTVTRQPVSAGSVFEVASISKSIAAYAALRLVDQGVLSLDDPVITYLREPWLRPSKYADEITIRQLLSHSSGLTNRVDVVDKRIEFEPGSRYSYSGVGYVYLQAIIEAATAKPLEAIAHEQVFAPLGMLDSSYVNSSHITDRLANGHVRLGSTQGLVTILAPLSLTLALTCLAGATIQRMRSGKWGLSARAFVVCYVAAALIRLGLHAWRLEGRGLKWATLAGLWTALLGVGLWVLLGLGRLLLGRFSHPKRSGRVALWARLVWAVGSVVVLLGLVTRLVVPVPSWPSEPANAAHSLRATAADLAAFLFELTDPKHLDAGLVAELRTPQAPVDANCAYGLGVGLCRSAVRGYIWHGGDNVDFHSIMAISARDGLGVVVLTNGQHGAQVARDVANLALGEPGDWRFSR